MKTFVTFLAAVLMTGCAGMITVTPPAETPIDNSRVYNVPFETVWLRAVDWFADHNVLIDKIEKSSGLITAKYQIKANEAFLDCGKIDASSGARGKTVERNGNLNVTVREIDKNNTRVNVNFFGRFDATAQDIWDGATIRASGNCVSTGLLEERVLSFIASN